ncbi:MAG: hypothetical protein WBE13_01635 [Candidatus Acidiferrum sp.]
MKRIELRAFLRVAHCGRRRCEKGEAGGAPPLFFVSVASKGLRFPVSCLESAFTGDCVSVASTRVTGGAKSEEFRLGLGMLAAGARGVLDAEGSEFKEGKQKRGKWREGEEDGVRVEPSIKYFTMDSYSLSIVFLFTCMSFERGGGDWKEGGGSGEV